MSEEHVIMLILAFTNSIFLLTAGIKLNANGCDGDFSVVWAALSLFVFLVVIILMLTGGAT